MTMMNAQARARAAARRIDGGYPHQVALPAEYCCRENYDILARFCRSLGVEPVMRQVRAEWPDRYGYEVRLYCFASRAQAEAFADHFEGEHFSPARDRDKNAWRRSDPWVEVDRFGPLTLPAFFRNDHCPVRPRKKAPLAIDAAS